MKRGPLKVFYSYAHEDEELRDRIDEHLELLRRQNLILSWHDRRIVPGTEWNDAIDKRLLSADMILLLISRAFMTSRYVNEVEIPEAMKVHKSTGIRVIPVLLEDATGWEKAPFAKLQILPSKAKPITDWDDPVEAFHDIANGIRRVARDIIIDGGGPFEFGPHEFTEAELAVLPKVERERTAEGLKRLHSDLSLKIPPRSYESNLLVATWSLRNFGRSDWLGDEPESLFYMAQIITSFDLVALQEIDINLHRLDALTEILGPDWRVLITDVAPGIKGNRERFAFLYYTPRVEFRNFASQMILPPERSPGGKLTPVQQFARPPLLAAFCSGKTEFQACTAHIVFGGVDLNAKKERLEEIRKLGNYLKSRARSEHKETDLLLLGDFQMGERESRIIDTLRENQVQIPDEVLHPTYFKKSKYYDLIGFVSPNRPIPLGSSSPRSGAYDFFQHVLREEDFNVYSKFDSFQNFKNRPLSSVGSSARMTNLERQYLLWKTFVISDHLPLWVELRVEGFLNDRES